jgi:protein arginine N-methyltransferase 7
MRVRCGRFPPIEKDMRMVLAHCGSLFLDPEALADVFRDLVTLEALHVQPDFSRYATVDAIAKKPLMLG